MDWSWSTSLIAIGGLLVTTAGAVLGAKEKDRRKFQPGPLVLAGLGLVVGVGAALNQYGATKESDRKSAEAQQKADAAYEELVLTKKVVDGASIYMEDSPRLTSCRPPPISYPALDRSDSRESLRDCKENQSNFSRSHRYRRNSSDKSRWRKGTLLLGVRT